MSQREALVRWAKAQVGLPYTTYRDCSGFTATAYRKIAVTIPEGSVAQWGAGTPTAHLDFEIGDLLFWDTFGPAPGHVALYVGNGYVVHALNEQRGIVTSVWNANMGGPYMGARRILPDEEDAPVVEDIPVPKSQRRKNRRRRLEHRP